MAKTLSGVARRELIEAVQARYRIASRAEKRLILHEFSAIAGYHPKSAIRVLNRVQAAEAAASRPARPRVYDETFRRTLVVLWEASDRVCGKRLGALLPTLVPALEHHGHLTIDSATRGKLMAISPASIDRLLREARGLSHRRSPRRTPTALRRSVPIRTYADWNAPPGEPGQMPLVEPAQQQLERSDTDHERHQHAQGQQAGRFSSAFGQQVLDLEHRRAQYRRNRQQEGKRGR